MDKDTALGWMILAGAGYLAYEWVVKGSPFAAIPDMLGLSFLTEGKIGSVIGENMWGSGTERKTVNVDPETGLVDLSGWDPQWALGYKPIANTVFGGGSVNVKKTDPSFARYGLTTAEVEYLQGRSPTFNLTWMKIVNGRTSELTAQERAVLAEVGWANTGAYT